MKQLKKLIEHQHQVRDKVESETADRLAASRPVDLIVWRDVLTPLIADIREAIRDPVILSAREVVA